MRHGKKECEISDGSRQSSRGQSRSYCKSKKQIRDRQSIPRVEKRSVFSRGDSCIIPSLSFCQRLAVKRDILRRHDEPTATTQGWSCERKRRRLNSESHHKIACKSHDVNTTVKGGRKPLLYALPPQPTEVALALLRLETNLSCPRNVIVRGRM